MSKLTDMINISKVSESKLKEVGITTPEELIAIGSKKAFLMLKQKDAGVCLDMLYGLEGAITNTKWHALSPETKEDLKAFFKSVNQDDNK